MLWLSISLPRLALDVLLRGRTSRPSPLVVHDGGTHRRWVHCCDPEASQLGIEPGMSLSAAHALSAFLHAHPRDPGLESEALEGIALWALQYTSLISLEPPHGLLLEIGASRKLFGGLHRLVRRIRDGLRILGYEARIAGAPTPLGARLLARAEVEQIVQDRPTLASRLSRLPLAVLEQPPDTIEALSRMGIRSLGECLGLPRDGLARRFGPRFVDYLDRALGQIPDPRPRFVPPERFQRRLELGAEADSSEALLFPLRRLLMELGGFLTARDLGVQILGVELIHAEGDPGLLTVGLVSPSRDIEHLLILAREHLSRHSLKAPVITVGLIARRLAPLEHRDQGLFGDSTRDEWDWPRLIEQLQARLGAEGIYGLSLTADHRPERAWERCKPGDAHMAVPTPSVRPLWLLESPWPLEKRDGYPWLEGRLELLLGPERIESGWWDGGDVRRDYFVAENPAHVRLWVFRQAGQAPEWFLHGIFA